MKKAIDKYEGTVEGFEESIESFKEQAKAISQPLPALIRCDQCGNGTGHLVHEYALLKVEDSLYYGDDCFYQCNNCNHCFGTDETTVITLASYKLKEE